MSPRVKFVMLAAVLVGLPLSSNAAHADTPAEAPTGAAPSAPATATSAQPASNDAPVAPGTSLAETSGEKARRALALFRQANRLYDDEKLKEAEALYEQAWSLSPTYDVATNYGALELDLHKPARAADLFSFALRHFPVRGKAAERAGVEARLAEAKKSVCTLRVKVSRSGAEIFVEGRSAGVAPVTREIFVEPGKRTVEAKLAGHREAKHVFVATAGGSRDVSLALEPMPAASPSAVSRDDGKVSSAIPGYVASAAGALGLGAGAALVGLAEKSRSDARAKHDELVGAGVSCATPSQACVELQGLTSQTDMLGNAGISALVAGGVLVTAGIGYVVWVSSGRAPKTQQSALRASVSASPSGGGFVLVGSF